MLGFFNGCCDDDAFACCQSIGFDNNGRALVANVLESRLELSETLILGGWNVMALEKFLRERFGPFELRSVGRGAEAGESLFLESIDDAGDERAFRADDCKADCLSCCEL